MQAYRAPGWLLGGGRLGGNLQTIWPALWSRRFDGRAPCYRRERWTTPDGDFIDVDWQVPPEGAAAIDGIAASGPSTARTPTLAGSASQPLLILFHGLEGSSGSHYAHAFAARAAACGWRFAVPHFRGCSGELNLAPRAYHSGDFEEIDWIVERFRAAHAGPIVAVGVSLGGNALLRWAEEAGDTARARLRAVAAVSAPVDLAASGAAIGRGFNRLVYNRLFLASMKPKALAKLAQHPGLFSRARLLAACDLYAFDDVFTAPLHGFAGTADYWRRASAKPQLPCIRLPALVLNALNDPFVPAASLPRTPQEAGPWVHLWQPVHGGHVGFPGGSLPGHVRTLPERVVGWLQERLAGEHRHG